MWDLIEKLVENKINLSEIEPALIEQIFVSILPGGNTLLHKAFKNP